MVKVIRKSIYILILLVFGVFAITLVGCSDKPYSVKYSYVSAESTQVYNSTEEQPLWIYENTKLSTEHANYVFESTVTDKQKDSFVDIAERILSDYPMEKADFVVGTSFNTAYVGDVHNAKNTRHESVDTFYFNIKDLSSVNLLVEINAKLFGEKTPYGLLYAYSYGQCVASKYNLPKQLSNNKLKEIINNNKDIIDLNAFVFLSPFTSDMEKSAAQTLAIKLYELLGNQQLQEIIEITDLKEQQNVLNLHTKIACYKNGITTQFNIGIKDYSCYHTQKYIVAENSDMNVRFFIARDYQLSFELETYLRNYTDLKLVLEKSLESFEKVNEFVENIFPAPADFYIENDLWDQTFGNYCYISSFFNITHEYCHMAMWDKVREDWNWTMEVIASYCGILLDDYRTEGILHSLSEYLGSDEHADKVYELLLKYPPTERIELWNILGYVYECFSPNQDLNNGTWRLPERIAPSFCNYLIETYGKQKFMKLCTTSYADEMEIYEKSLDQLRAEWFATMQERFE